MKHRWQTWVRRGDDRNPPPIPEGWGTAPSEWGAWHPVALDGPNLVLLRRLLRPVKAPSRQTGLQPRPDSLPAWMGGVKAPTGSSRKEVADMVVACIAEITQREVNPARCKGAAVEVIRLWRSVGEPPPAEFVAEVALVAHAARECSARLFARDIRGEGWEDGGTDRSRSVPTLTVVRRFEERLQAARDWQREERERAERDKIERERTPTRSGLPHFSLE